MIRHEAIFASAGSGKTFQLAHRYIRLLSQGVAPERIVALTFSRKAAGEIFDSIMEHLTRAATSGEAAVRLGNRIGKPEFHPPDAIRLLRGVTDSLHRLHIGTLDSFIVRVIRTFPLELGVEGDVEILDTEGAAARETRRAVLERIFNGRLVDPGAQNEFQQAFKEATFGHEEKGLERLLNDFIEGYREHYQVLPVPEAWGQEEIIWPGGSPWLKSAGDVSVVVGRLRKSLEQRGLPDKWMERWGRFLEAAGRYGATSEWTDEIGFLFERLADALPDLTRGSATISTDRRSVELAPDECRMALAVLTHLMGVEIRSALRRSRGIFRVLDQYERQYDFLIRRRGQLTFSDAQYLLTAGNRANGGLQVSRFAGQAGRLYVDYRLDCSLDHWLLDEFQDTSDLQWETLANLADEILQDASGEKSIFFVGDVKQAIYGWRGGNARLFGKIVGRYGSRIEQRSLSTSFRSCACVMETVNRVFDDLSESELPPAVVTEWRAMWQPHRSDAEIAPREGGVALLEPETGPEGDTPAAEDRYVIAARLLSEIDPVGRGLSAAVLVRTNKSGREVVGVLRRECPGMNIAHEGKASVLDNPVVAVLMALVTFAAHPGDTLAEGIIRMSPLRGVIEKEGPDWETLPMALLKEIAYSGFQSFLGRWGKRLEEVHSLDDFGRQRLEDVLMAAAEFDRRGRRDCNAFLRFVEGWEMNEPASDDAVRVMTIHQSKGLGFDVVILPDLQDRSVLDQDVDLITARHRTTGLPRWALRMPRKVVAESDAALAEERRRRVEDGCLEQLCVLYVAITRARRGLYMITSPPSRRSKSLTFAALLRRQIGRKGTGNGMEIVSIGGRRAACLYEAGTRNWYGNAPRAAARSGPGIPSRAAHEIRWKHSRTARLILVEPSGQVSIAGSAGRLFSEEGRQSRDLGSAVHEIFRRISWIDETDFDAVIREWEPTATHDLPTKEMAVEHLRNAFSHKAIRDALTRPAGNVELWRERAFDMVLRDQWVSGVFDRVIVVKDGAGRVLRATVQDFKTDGVSDAAAIRTTIDTYRPQMRLYGHALSRMLRLEASRISLQILLTHSGVVRTVDEA
jgi:ATP-dependent exoDNAse (exonuclease V) beta subunit